ncbi:MAG: hypothetical protein LBC03_06575 [Nitrososphaerota archaeon]|nr:hypothetical protein [Nitrososphaerota archaeon]
MERKSKRNLIILILAVVTVLVVSSVIITVVVVNTNPNGMKYESGVFIMKSQSNTNNRWTISAQSANGQSTIFRNLNQENLDRFSVDSSITDGKMLLILSQDENSQTIDLSEGTMNLSAEDIGMDSFNPGQISMQLKFDNAKNFAVTVSWR